VIPGTEPYRVSLSFGRITQNSLPSGPTSTACPMPTRLPQREMPLSLLFAILRAASRVVGPDDDLTLQPGACVQSRASQPGQS